MKTLRRTEPRLRTARPRRTAARAWCALAVLGLLAAACGADAQPVTGGSGAAATPEAAPATDFATTRPGAGIAAAGGNPQAVTGVYPCDQPGSDPIVIAYVGANLAELDAIGLEAISVEEPGLVIDAYTNEVNFKGGINGRCVEFVNHLWSPADPVGSFTRICTDMPAQRTAFYFSLSITEAIIDCATKGAQIPIVGLYASRPDSTFTGESGRLFFFDDGSVEYLLSKTLTTALAAGAMETGERVALLHGSGPSAGMGTQTVDAIIERKGVERVATIRVPAEYGDLQLLLAERSVRLLESGLSDAESAEARSNLAALPPELAGQFTEMAQFYLDAANTLRDREVSTVIATSDWADLRRMMRAAELIDWTPRWLANDMQPSTVLMQEVPRRQAENVLVVSGRRAAGDAITDLDRGCITLRNTATEAPPFAHRLHTDAWTLITAVCDYLDVTFAALTNIDGPVTPDSFARAMHGTDYLTQHGAAITFTAGDHSGSDRFRVLQADPECVLNSWGCMRSTTGWFIPAPGSAATGAIAG